MDYQSTYRRGEFAVPALIIVMLSMAGGIALAIRTFESNALLTVILEILGASIIAIIVIFASVFRVHRWTIVDGGMTVSERPRVPLMGRRRSADLRWHQIAALRRIESGVDHQLELVGPDARRYRISEGIKAGVGVDPNASLEAFRAAILASAQSAGAAIPDLAEGMSFWNKVPGLAFLTVMLAIAALFAGATGWAFLDGGISYFPRSGYLIAIALALPVGAGWLLMASLRRRWKVLASRPGNG